MSQLAHPVNPDTFRVLILTNPKAGARSGLPAVEALDQYLTARNMEVETTSDIAELSELSSKYHQKGELRAVLGAGGDGTIALVANHTPPTATLGILPLGTENLLSKYLNIDATPAAVGENVLNGGVVPIDAGKANDRIFLLMAGCGRRSVVCYQGDCAIATSSQDRSKLPFLMVLGAQFAEFGDIGGSFNLHISGR